MGESFAELHKYREAISSEFAEEQISDDPEVLIAKLKKVLTPAVGDLAENMLRIAQHGESDAVQVSATKTIYSLLGIIKSGKGESKADELTELFRDLAKNDANT
jgi:imidazoleglycerol phosphate synthase glutamine amidotransferase subunit HisH